MLDRLQALLRKAIDAAGALGALCVFLLFVLMIVGGIGRQLNLQVSGINDRVDLAAVERVARRRVNEGWMRKGVTMIDPESVYIDADIAHLAFDHCFEGWSGLARVRDEKLALRVTSSLPYLVVFTPELKDYFCVEPVSHVSNAIHMSDPAAHGLRAVEPNATFDAWMKLEIAHA